MILKGTDYLTTPVRFGQTGKTIQEATFGSNLLRVPVHSLEGPPSGGSGSKAPPNPGALEFPTPGTWHCVKSGHIRQAWKYEASLAKSHLQLMQTKTPPTGLLRTLIWGPALDPLGKVLSDTQAGQLLCCLLLYYWLPTWAAFPFKVLFQTHRTPTQDPAILTCLSAELKRLS